LESTGEAQQYQKGHDFITQKTEVLEKHFDFTV